MDPPPFSHFVNQSRDYLQQNLLLFNEFELFSIEILKNSNEILMHDFSLLI